MSVGTRLDALERVVGTEPPDRCTNCGADWIGSTVEAIESDGRRRWACIRCLADRREPRPYVRRWAYPVELLRCL